MAYEIQPFKLLDAGASSYAGGVGTPSDYEYFVDPTTRTVQRRAKQGLPAYAGTATGGGDSGGSGGFTPAGSASGRGSGKAGGPSLAAQNAALGAMSFGSKTAGMPGLVGLLGAAFGLGGRAAADAQLDYIGNNTGLLGEPTLPGVQTVSDINGNVFTQSTPQSIQDANIAMFGADGYDTSIGGYTGQTDTNTNADTSGSPGYGAGGFL